MIHQKGEQKEDAG